ncbi:MAG: type II toxin-antitoxin system Phd/YefM family antitoxin [Desulfotignum sp.]
MSRYLEKLAKGEVIILCKRNVPVAEIRGIPSKNVKSQRPIGLAKEDFTVPESFFDPLPEEMLADFDGETE